MRTLEDFTLSTTWLPQNIAEPVDTLVLAFRGVEAGIMAAGEDDGWQPLTMGLGWTQDGLVLTGLREPLLFIFPDLAEEGFWTREDAFEAIAQHGGLVICALADDDTPLQVARFRVSDRDPHQIHFLVQF